MSNICIFHSRWEDKRTWPEW